MGSLFARRSTLLLQYIPQVLDPASVLLTLLSVLAFRKTTKYVQRKCSSVSLGESTIEETTFPSNGEIGRILERIGGARPRTTGSEVHNNLIDWLEQELSALPGLEIHSDEYEILRWQIRPGHFLKDAGRLKVCIVDGEEIIPLSGSGAVSFSKVTSNKEAHLAYLPDRKPITEHDTKGKTILRDFPMYSIPYYLIFL